MLTPRKKQKKRATLIAAGIKRNEAACSNTQKRKQTLENEINKMKAPKQGYASPA